MPPTNKPPWTKRFRYSDDAMKKAINAVKEGISLNSAALSYNVPKSTLHARITGKTPEGRKAGSIAVLSPEEEDQLTAWILSKRQAGIIVHADEVKDAVQKMLLESPRENRFKNNRPGQNWYSHFVQRHPEINAGKNLHAKPKMTATEEELRWWFQEAVNFLSDNVAASVLERPAGVFYTETMEIDVCRQTGIVLGPKTDRETFDVLDKEFITVLSTFSAAGDVCPPMVTYPYKRIPIHIHLSFPPEWSIAKSETGLMDNSIFQEYITKNFHRWCVKQNIEFPVIVFTHFQKHQVSAELHDFCKKTGIFIYSLPPSSTGLMREFDIAVLRPLRSFWKREISSGQQPREKTITKSTFAPVCKRSFDEFLDNQRKDVIQKAFKMVGLFPFDENVVDYKRCHSMATSAESSEGEITMKEFRAAKKVIEQFIGLQQTELYEKMREEQNPDTSGDSLFWCWKMCANKLEGLDRSESEAETVSQETCEDIEEDEFIIEEYLDSDESS